MELEVEMDEDLRQCCENSISVLQAVIEIAD